MKSWPEAYGRVSWSPPLLKESDLAWKAPALFPAAGQGGWVIQLMELNTTDKEQNNALCTDRVTWETSLFLLGGPSTGAHVKVTPDISGSWMRPSVDACRISDL